MVFTEIFLIVVSFQRFGFLFIELVDIGFQKPNETKLLVVIVGLTFFKIALHWWDSFGFGLWYKIIEWYFIGLCFWFFDFGFWGWFMHILRYELSLCLLELFIFFLDFGWEGHGWLMWRWISFSTLMFFEFLFLFDLILDIIQIILVHVGEEVIGGLLLGLGFSLTIFRLGFIPDYGYWILLPA